MNENTHAAGGALLSLGLLLFIAVFVLALYVFGCFCYKRICEKCGVTPGVLIWIPIVQFIPLLEVARMPVWTIILMFIPLVNIVWMVMLFSKICVARGKSGWLVILLFVPIANLIFIPYLAFSE
jgi:Family of unknown function (DUF5684)